MSTIEVGSVSFPIPEGEQDAPLRDPVSTVLLHYCAHWLNWGLADKLERMRPTAKEAVPTVDGVPVNLGEFDPGTAFVRRPLPALYMWCPSSVTEAWTQLKDLRTAEYHLRYYFQPLTMPGGMTSRSGVMPDADRLLHAASSERRHPTFPPAAVQAVLPVTIAVGSSIEKALCLRELKLIRSIFGTTWEEAGQQSAGENISRNLGGGADGGVQRGFPTLHCVWQVKEVVDSSLIDGSEETPDLQLTINASTGEGEGYVEMMTRNLNAPDGAGPDQKDDFTPSSRINAPRSAVRVLWESDKSIWLPGDISPPRRVSMGPTCLDYDWETDTRSYSFWVKSSAIGTLFGKRTDGAGRHGWRVYLGSSGQLSLSIEQNFVKQASNYADGTNLADGAWHHAVVIVTAPADPNATFDFYVDGIYKPRYFSAPWDSLAPPDPTTNTEPFTLGWHNLGTSAPNGAACFLDEVAAYSSALSLSDVTALFNGGKPPDPRYLSSWASNIGYWRCGDEGAYPTIPDVGNGPSANDGTMLNLSPSNITNDHP